MKNQYPNSSRENRLNAIKEGNKIYNGVPCKHCGTTEKHVSSYSCVKCNIERNIHKLYDNDLMSQYRTPEKNKEYWNQNKNRKKIIQEKYSKSEKGIVANNIKSSKRRARIKNQLSDDVDFNKITKIYEECRKLSIETGIPHEVDHIIPISKGGMHHQDNLQIITMSENRRKGSKIL